MQKGNLFPGVRGSPTIIIIREAFASLCATLQNDLAPPKEGSYEQARTKRKSRQFVCRINAVKDYFRVLVNSREHNQFKSIISRIIGVRVSKGWILIFVTTCQSPLGSPRESRSEAPKEFCGIQCIIVKSVSVSHTRGCISRFDVFVRHHANKSDS